jgi:hypothetical protein
MRPQRGSRLSCSGSEEPLHRDRSEDLLRLAPVPLQSDLNGIVPKNNPDLTSPLFPFTQQSSPEGLYCFALVHKEPLLLRPVQRPGATRPDLKAADLSDPIPRNRFVSTNGPNTFAKQF